MEFRRRPNIVFAIFMAFFFMIIFSGHILTGKSDEMMDLNSSSLSSSESEVYEIDYKGPETHALMPLPNEHSGVRHKQHNTAAVVHPTSKGLGASVLFGRRGNKVRG